MPQKFEKKAGAIPRESCLMRDVITKKKEKPAEGSMSRRVLVNKTTKNQWGSSQKRMRGV